MFSSASSLANADAQKGEKVRKSTSGHVGGEAYTAKFFGDEIYGRYPRTKFPAVQAQLQRYHTFLSVLMAFPGKGGNNVSFAVHMLRLVLCEQLACSHRGLCLMGTRKQGIGISQKPAFFCLYRCSDSPRFSSLMQLMQTYANRTRHIIVQNYGIYQDG